MKTYTCTEIAENFNLWCEYFDPHGEMSKDVFDNMTVEDRVTMIHDIYPLGSLDCHCQE